MTRPVCIFLTICILSCTESGIYAAGVGGSTGPDRVEIIGRACVPLAGGDAFPVKVLYAIEGGGVVDRTAVGEITDSLQDIVSRFSDPYIKFSLVAFHTLATGLEGRFVPAADLTTAISKYASYNESGPISIRSPLKLSRSLLSGDMQTGCRGSVARTRYLIVLLIYSADQSCANPDFNANIDADCNAFVQSNPPDFNQCSTCELVRRTQDLRRLAAQYGAGEVSIQPVFVNQTGDMAARYQAAEIAKAGGTELVETNPGNLKATLTALNYTSLQRSLKLKRLIAFNRNTISRQGVMLIDSDGDGLPDDDEKRYGTKPDEPDSDLDGINDAVEIKMGMNPFVYDTINGCSPTSDTDGDRLLDCEERVLGTDSCITDTDGDGLPDFVEFHQATNPLVAEDLEDADRDGRTNVQEVLMHTDANSADIAYSQNRAYGYSVSETSLDGKPLLTPDGRQCYDIDAYNISVVQTMERQTLIGRVPKGNNEIYLYFMVGRDNDPRGTGIGSLFATTIQFIPPNRKRPKGIIQVQPEEFVLGQ